MISGFVPGKKLFGFVAFIVSMSIDGSPSNEEVKSTLILFSSKRSRINGFKKIHTKSIVVLTKMKDKSACLP